MTLDQIRTTTYLYTSTSGTADFPDATLVALANNALERVVSLINSADGRWQFDDSNNTDLPIATTDIVLNQQDYALATSHLQINRAEIKDASGNWQKLTPIDQTDLYNQSLTDFMKTAGTPVYYDKIANSVLLYPTPNYSQAASLKLYFERGPSYFLTSDTTKAPGFNTLFHDLIPLWVSYNFAIANGKANAQALQTEIQQHEDALVEYYALRSHDDPIRLRARPRNYK
jgi:hypothetical protein